MFQSSNKHNELLVKRINDTKNIYLCPALVKDKYIIRLAICAKSTTVEDIEYSWREIQRLGDQILEESSLDSNTNIKTTISVQVKMSTTNSTTNNGLVTSAVPAPAVATTQVAKLNGKMHLPVKTTLGRSFSDISVVSLPRLNDLKTAYANLLEAAGEDISREGLLKTPERAAKAFEFFTAGYHADLNSKCLHYDTYADIYQACDSYAKREF